MNINNIWYDFANLLLMTFYFFYFGNPINSKQIKCSFSMTKSLEVALDKYSDYKIKKKALVKKHNDHVI